MFASIKSGLRRTRVGLIAIAATLLTALIITPAHAAVGADDLEGGAIAAVIIVGTLAFALTYEIWHLASHKSPHSRHDKTN